MTTPLDPDVVDLAAAVVATEVVMANRIRHARLCAGGDPAAFPDYGPTPVDLLDVGLRVVGQLLERGWQPPAPDGAT